MSLTQLLTTTTIIAILISMTTPATCRAYRHAKRTIKAVSEYNNARIIAATHYENSRVLDGMLTNGIPRQSNEDVVLSKP